MARSSKLESGFQDKLRNELKDYGYEDFYHLELVTPKSL